MAGDEPEEKTNIHRIVQLANDDQVKVGFLVVLGSKSSTVTGRMFKLEKQESIAGRASEADIFLLDDGISRRHAKFVQRPDGSFELVDMGSTNGTYVNGERVRGSVPLRDGDKIQIGSTTILMFSLQDKFEEQFQRSLFESATRDSLTGAFNKKYFLDALNKDVAYCLRHNVPLSLVMIDVDHFKQVNDTYGHPAGDYVLHMLARKLQETIRAEDLLARYGGEEFAILLRETPSHTARVCAERCRAQIQKTDFTFHGTPIRSTISLGVATLLEDDARTAETLLQAADAYLYMAKSAGRNRVEGR